MNPFESSDPHFLARASERSLERSRYELVMNCDDRREAVIDELLRRGTPIVTGETVRLGRDAGLSRQQIIAAGEEATVTLAMRLRIATRLQMITPLARDLASNAIRARAPECEGPPQLASRRPDLRDIGAEPAGGASKEPIRRSSSIEAELREAARRGRIKRNNPETS